jgi:short-subunit dehydrogenase
MELAGKTAWVTGASSGIGEALAKGLIARGANVILSGRRVEELERVAKAAGGKTLVLPFEATDYDALPALVKTASSWTGGVDLLVNNAGVSQRSLALDTAFDVYRRIMEIDFFAPLRLTQLVLPSMSARKSGYIVIISSVAGKVGAPLRTAYCAAKHACVGYYDALRAEVDAAYGIGVSVVLPGSVRTNVAVNALEGDGSSRGRSDENIDSGMAPERAAEIILDGVAKGEREIPVAEGMELAALQMRAANPEALFGFVAQEGARLAAAREKGAAIDPAMVNRAED